MAQLSARGLTLQYEQRRVVEGLSTEVPEGKVTMIVGANACGKSTLLRGLSRLLKPSAGVVTLDGKDIHSRPARELAARSAFFRSTPSPRTASPSANWWAADGIRTKGSSATGGLATGRCMISPSNAHSRPRQRLSLLNGTSTNCPVGSARGCGSPWPLRRRPRSCSLTNPPPTLTWHTKWRCWTW